MADFCKILIVEGKQCLVQIVTKEDGYGLQFTTEGIDNWIAATLGPIPTIEKARDMLDKTNEKICKDIIGDVLNQFNKDKENGSVHPTSEDPTGSQVDSTEDR